MEAIVPRAAEGADLLATIVAATRRIVEVRESRTPRARLERRAAAAAPRAAAFEAALRREDGLNVIAECKRRSPSRGVIRPGYDAAAVARGYEAAGAAAVSVLTEPAFFDGSPEHLHEVRLAITLPLLRKDFIVSEYQVLEARAAGADAVLLIVAALDGATLQRLLMASREAGLAALVEVHDEEELQRAVDAGAAIVGVNNRNLRTLETDTRVSERLIARMPRGVAAVAESGLRDGATLWTLRQMGYTAFLIGEFLMAQPDPGDALRRLMADAATQHVAAGRARTSG